jgi:hypothetical protein
VIVLADIADNKNMPDAETRLERHKKACGSVWGPPDRTDLQVYQPEALATKWIISETQNQMDDPLEKFIGKFNFNKSNWADNHDQFVWEKIR